MTSQKKKKKNQVYTDRTTTIRKKGKKTKVRFVKPYINTSDVNVLVLSNLSFCDSKISVSIDTVTLSFKVFGAVTCSVNI